MSSSVLRSACYALRRGPTSLRVLTEKLTPPRAQNSSTRRFYSADSTAVAKPVKTNPSSVLDGRKLDEIKRLMDENNDLVIKFTKVRLEEIERERRRQAFWRGTIFAGGALAATYYVKQRFFGGTKENKEMSTGTKDDKMSTVNN